MEEIQRRFPDAPLFAAGYSLGSLILTKYLAEADTGKWMGEGVHLSEQLIRPRVCTHQDMQGDCLAKTQAVRHDMHMGER